MTLTYMSGQKVSITCGVLIRCPASTMEQAHRDKIRKNLVLLSKELDVVLILPYLYKEHIFSDFHIEKIIYQEVQAQRFWYFITTLQRSGPKAFPVFIDAVAEVQTHLFELMDI